MKFQCSGRFKKKEMANQNSGEGSSSGNVSVESTDSTVQLNIKTLESQVYSVQAEKNMLVSSFKEKIADEVGVPVGQQRLIFRGKVLKDEHPLSEYHVENEDTLHLVARQPAQSQDSSGPSAGNENPQGNDPSGGAPRNRIAQISHSVVLGTFNAGDQGEGGSADISRVIGAVLNSMGIGNQAVGNGTGGMQSANMSNNSGTSPLGNGTEGNVGGPSPTEVGNQPQPGHAFPIQSFQSLPQIMQIPRAASGVPLPTLNTPIPSSLTTISEFMTRMEQALSQDGDSLNTSSNSGEERPRVNLPSNEQGLHTPEALSIVLRQAERLLSNQAVASLSHIARGLEQETIYTNLNARGQVHGEAMRVGLAVQHLGALLLELGRTIMTLQLGNSRVQSGVNSGPAIYISPSGPNPIMVQPFPLQTNSLFSGSFPPSNPINLGPVGVGPGHRNVNIHIHAGTSLGPVVAQVGTRSSTGDGRQGERNSRTGSADSRSSGIATSNAPQPASGASDSNPVSIPNLVSEINSRVRSLIGNMQGDNPLHSGPAESNAVQNASAPSISRDVENDNDSTSSRIVNGDGESNVSLPRSVPQQVGCEPARGVSGSEGDLTESAKDSDCSLTSQKKENVGETAPGSSKTNDKNEGAKAVPLGLGFGGLERKRRAKPQQSPAQSGESGTTSIIQNHQSRSNQQVRQSGPQGSDEEPDMASVMSQVLQSPALNGLLSGVSQQTGAGSPDALRNMLQQFTQSPQMRNVVNQIAQQVDTEEVENMFGETGGQGGGGGGLDISRMFQQMMPIVSRALGVGGSGPGIVPQQRPVTRSLPSGCDNNTPSLQSLAGTIEDMNAPEDIFRTLVENSVGESGPGGVVDELCSDEDLVNEYIGLLQNEMRQRYQDESER